MSIPPSLVPDSITVTLTEFVKAAQPAPGTDSRIFTFSMFQYSDVEVGSTPSFTQMTNDWFTQAFIPVLKQYALAEIIDSTVQYVPNALTYGGSDQLSIAHIQQLITPALGAIATVPDFVGFSGMKIFPQNLRSTSRYNPSAYAKRLGIPHIVDAGLLTNPAYNYATPYYHAFLVERPQALATS